MKYPSKNLLGRYGLCFLACSTLLIALSSNMVFGLSNSDYQRIVTNTPFYDPSATGASTCASDVSTTLIGNDNIQKAFNFLTGQGLSAAQASGVIGNLEQESGNGLNPLAQENRSTSTTPIPNVGFGIAQWTTPSRQQGLEQLAQKESGTPGDLSVQLNYLWQELTTTYANVLQNLKATTNVDDAVNAFVGPDNTAGQPVAPTDEVQRSGGYENPGTPIMQNRLGYAEAVLAQYGGAAGSGSTVTTSSTTGCAGGVVNCSNPSATTGLSQTRQNVVCIAQQELAKWQSGQLQPGTGYKTYSKGQDEDWCADFVSWVYNQANYPLQTSPSWDVAAVVGVENIGQAGGNFQWHPAGNYTPVPGDIIVHNQGGERHVNIVVSVTGNSMAVIGGNQHGGGDFNTNLVTQYTDGGFSNIDDITGYVSPTN